MKLTSVTLENFGIYGRKQFQFNAAPLVLIYGPNESGKTTALNGLRQALFGFKLRTPYLTGRQMAAHVDARLSDDRQVEFYRRKARKDELEGFIDGRKSSPEEIQALFSNFDLASYEQLFGFSLEELRAGENALKTSRLADALAGGAMGGMSALQSLQSEIATTLAELYKARGSTSKINVQLNEIRKVQESLRQSQALPSEIEDLQQQLADLQVKAQSVRSQQSEVFARRSIVESQLKALPLFLEREAISERLRAIKIPDGIDSSSVAQWSDYVKQRRELLSQREAEASAMEREEAEYAQVSGSRDLTEFERDIELLGHQAEEMSSLRTRRSDLLEQRDDAQSICDRLLKSLKLEALTESLSQRAFTVAERTRLAELSREHAQLSNERIALQAKLDAAQEALCSQQEHTQDVIPSNVHELKDFVARIEQTQRQFELRSRELEKAKAEFDCSPALLSVRSMLDDTIEVELDWALPSVERVQTWLNDWAELDRETESNCKSTMEVTRQLKEARESLAALQLLEADQFVKLLREKDARRDEILSTWLDDLSHPLIATSVSIDDQRSRLTELKQLAEASGELQQGVIRSAESLARLNQCEREVEQHQQTLSLLEEASNSLELRRNSLHTTWAELWQAIPFQLSASPKCLKWLTDFYALKAAADRLDALRRDMHQTRSATRHLRNQLIDIWPSNLRADFDLIAIGEQIRKWEQAVRDQKKERVRSVAANRTVQSLTEKLQKLAIREEQLLREYKSWRATVPIEGDWELAQAPSLIDSLEHLRREDDTQRRAVRQLQAVESRIESFESSVRDLSKRIGEQNEDCFAEFLARGWLRELLAVREDRSRRIQLRASIDFRRKRIADFAARLSQLESKIGHLAELFTSKSEESTPLGISSAESVVAKVKQREELLARIAELNATLSAFCRDATLEDFCQSLANLDAGSLNFDLKEIDRQVQGLDDASREANQQIGSLMEKFDRISNNQLALRNQQLLHNQRNELAELCEQWVVNRLAQELLNRSITRFASEHEPALLQYARTYLASLTGQRYVDIEHDSNSVGGFVIRNANSEAFTPDILSTGTREQLYLAIRMAYISFHCDEHEPLPVIMDDCFVNFDDARTRLALESIESWDSSMQTIVLSCHGRVVQILADFAPDTPVIHLEKEALLSAGELAANAAIENN